MSVIVVFLRPLGLPTLLIDRAGKKWVVSGPLAGVLPGLIGGANLNVVYETTTGTQNLLPNLNLRMFRIGQATGGLEGGEEAGGKALGIGGERSVELEPAELPVAGGAILSCAARKRHPVRGGG